MTPPPPSPACRRYTGVAIWLHWAIAAAILINLTLGYLCGLLDFAVEDPVLNLHKVLGIAILGLTLVRLGWRLGHRPPPPLAAGQMQARLAGAVHFALYALSILLPLSGWLVTSSFPERHPISLFLVDLPFLPVEQNLDTAIRAHGAHEVLGFLMLVLAAGHMLAGVYHHFVLRDGIMDRLRPFSRRNP